MSGNSKSVQYSFSVKSFCRKDRYIEQEEDDTIISSCEDYISDRNDVSLREILHSASSYDAIAFPVFVTMLLSSLAAVFINTEQTISNGEKQFAEAYNIWKLDNNNNKMKLFLSIGNTMVIVCVIALITFGIVLLYKFRCMKLLIGYMVTSSATLLGFLGYYITSLAIDIYRISIDVVTYYILLYNFAVVGVVAIFYQKGIPKYITQMYLVATSVILAWNLSHFDDWTAWTLLVMLALYDLCAVLTPCGPLKALVKLMQKDDSPEMPGLLYEAKVEGGRQNKRQKYGNFNKKSMNKCEPKSNFSKKESRENNVNWSFHIKCERVVSIPLAIARVYMLPLVSSDVNCNDSLIKVHNDINIKEQGQLPLLSEYQNLSIKSFYNRRFSVKDLISEVKAELPSNGCKIEKLKDRSNTFEIYNHHGELKRILTVNIKTGEVYEVDDDEFSRYSSYSDDDKSNVIRLGLGDFIFYSVLVAKAAMYGFTTFAACILVILAGLGGTLVLLSLYKSALPALPISIFLGVFFYMFTRLLIEPWVETIMTDLFYV